MILAIDIGNTHIVAGVLDEKQVLCVGRFRTDREATEEEYEIKLKIWMEIHHIPVKELEGAILSTVVPPLISVFTQTLRSLLGKEPCVVGPGIRTGLNIRIDNPAQLGADMVVAAVASIDRYPLPQIIFDLGTATTVSVIDSKGVFRGCVILSGIISSLNALSSSASQLPFIDITAPKHVVGTNTIDSMLSGCIYGAASMMDGLIDRINDEMNMDACVIATGGLASSVAPYCRHPITLDDDLLLQGLLLIYRKNQEAH